MEEVPRSTAADPDVGRRNPDPGEDLPTIRVLGPDGRAARGTTVGSDQAREIYRGMLWARLVEERLERLSADAWIGFLPLSFGDEAAQVGSVVALGDEAWLFPGARDRGALLARGVPVETLADQVFGNADDPQKGRQMPGFVGSRRHRVASPSAPPGTHLTHAVGFAWASLIKGSPELTAAFFSSAEAGSHDFHTALNFAGVHRVPTVFVGRGPAASDGDATLAGRGIAYGVPAVRADGTDPLAVVEAVAEAAGRAKAGDGPTLVELVVDRRGSGDLGGPDDPVTRMRVHLAAEGTWSDDEEATTRSDLDGTLQRALEAAAQKPAPAPATLFDDVWDERPDHLRAQLSELERAR